MLVGAGVSVVELQAQDGAHDGAHVLLLVLEHDELVGVGVPSHEQQVEHPDRAVIRELRELVRNPALEVRARGEADVEQLHRSDVGHC